MRAISHVSALAPSSEQEGILSFKNILQHGDAATRASFLIMGFGCLKRRQFIKGMLYLAAQVLFFAYMIGFAWQYLGKLGTLGDQAMRREWSEARQIYVRTPGDNSMLILLFSVMSLLLIIGFALLWRASVRASYKAQLVEEKGKKQPTFADTIRALMDKQFHVTMLTLPTVMIIAFTVLPIIFMILIAFTNFDADHQPPGNMFTWVGLKNFTEVFWSDALKAGTFGQILVWTLVWAVFATFSNYFFGMILALMINKKTVRLKKLWRTIFVITIAVPQFVSLMLMSQILHDQGPLNTLLKQWGFISENIPFLTNATFARITVVVVNIWVGIPYTMLITSGILMNIPADLYESASIDGASPVRMFMSITLPYMLFVTTPYLITAFVGNINNFNVIYLLTRGGPLVTDYYQAGKTDLLVTWLYKLTVDKQNYSLASTIGIFVFIICASMSLIVYNLSGSSRKEEEFQ
ncbi:MAG: sugar ABC transporter permease [Eubacteriales bacterium]|jgi:arabinogalactan oligomer/maltooligosaccharide transport system permease protein|nr:sugar ABC transporter permease [Eubacteriales bacterium]MDD4106240.1 sugar ABC transporter permease [Eubacteriales bacterium]MDD4711429.1 sugar ABC transporter permease [Eubacteriales bacterium]NLO16516.1 sugar ABC transporter permease [Clostridiales bacterium]